MNDTDLFNKAAKAGYDYRKVYGVFPGKIGIHHKRLSHFGRQQIIFPEMPSLARVDWTTPAQLEAITISQHRATFEPVSGIEIEWDEVYLPFPGSEHKVMSSASLAFYATGQKQVPDKPTIYRAIEAERKEEVNVCSDCYGFYLPMRKLQEIYDPWFAPQCDYCDRPAKYHVHRSDWVGVKS